MADETVVNLTLHHEMRRNVPNGHFHVFIFSESKFYAIYNGENHFKSEDERPNNMFFNMVVRHSVLLGKHALNVEDFYVKTIG